MCIALFLCWNRFYRVGYELGNIKIPVRIHNVKACTYTKWTAPLSLCCIIRYFWYRLWCLYKEQESSRTVKISSLRYRCLHSQRQRLVDNVYKQNCPLCVLRYESCLKSLSTLTSSSKSDFKDPVPESLTRLAGHEYNDSEFVKKEFHPDRFFAYLPSSPWRSVRWVYIKRVTNLRVNN